MKTFSQENTKMLLFLINFFDGIGLAFNYPWYIFYNQTYTSKQIESFWKEHNETNYPTQLYIHTLFCETKCHYCNCISYVENDQKKHAIYKEFLLNEIYKYGKVVKKDLDTLYFGGGTFSLWGEEDMEDILKAVKKNFSFKKNYKWMVELHPESTSRKKLEILKHYGITNVMVGLQSLNEKVSVKNNRPYDEGKINEVIDDIIDLKFDKICLDIMYNLPYETYEDLQGSIIKLRKLGERIKGKIDVNLEVNKWNMSYYVPYYKIGISDNFDRLQDFIVDYFSLLDRKNLLIKDFRDTYLKDLFGHHREEIHSRIKNNTAILGLGYGAISYIPGVASYSFDFSYKKIRNFYKDISYSGHNLSEKDSTNFLFLNNIRAGVNQELMKKAFSQADSGIGDSFQNIKKDLQINPDGKIVANVDDDMSIHMMALCFYGYDQRRIVFKKLLKKWIGLGNSYDDLEENVNTYLSLYYRRS